MKILGIDPGLATMGYGVLEKKPRSIVCVEYGAIRTTQGLPIGERLDTIQKELTRLVKLHTPDIACVETLFFFSNQKTIMQIGQVLGIVSLTFHKRNVPIAHYPPLRIKNIVAGNGKAKKKEIQEKTRFILKLPKEKYPDDTYDALAVALCHIYMEQQAKTASVPKKKLKLAVS